ncbi:MAG: hypothetical protein ACOYYS_14960 [Chloroflexota bacterium]
MKRIAYSLLTYRLDQVWFPAGLWALFAIILLIMRGTADQAFNMARSYLGAVMPLTAGIMAAYALLEDPALELRFAIRLPAWKALAERLAITFAIAAITALGFQGVTALLGVSLEPLGGFWAIQLAWLAPTLALMALGCTVSLAFGQSNGGAIVVGLVWLMELLLRGWFIDHRWARYLLVFFGILAPEHPSLPANQVTLLLLAALLLLGAQHLFKQQERYI